MKRASLNRRALTRMACVLIAVAMVAALSGCSALSSYSATSYQQVTQLKAFHLLFIDEFTTDAPVSLDRARLMDQEDAGELKFREAEEFSAGLKDQSRTYNAQILHRMFENNVAWLQKGSTFGKANAGEQKMVLQSAYDQAIRGETVRPGVQK